MSGSGKGLDIRRGDVVTVRYDPAEGHEPNKTRPSVVVQNDMGNKNSGTTIVAPGTGTHRGYPFEVLVEADGSPFDKDTSVRADQLRVVDVTRRVHSVIGSLNDSTMERIDRALRISLALRDD